MADWDEFIHWALRVVVEVDLDKEEREYKVDTAAKLSRVRDFLLTDDVGWSDELRRALQTNLLNRFFLMTMFEDLKNLDADLHRVLSEFWGTADVAGLDQLARELRPLGTRYTQGNVLSLGSVLLMALDAGAYPPFRVTPVQKWSKLVDGPVMPGSAAGRYQLLLDLCDELIRRTADWPKPMRDRLDAQGLGWAVLNYDPPDAWPEAERDAFIGWRGGLPVAATDDEPVLDRGTGGAPLVEETAWWILEPGLSGQPSTLDSTVHTWTSAAATELFERVQLAPDEGPQSFMGKLEGQLQGATRPAVLLAAELLALHVLPLSNVRAVTKRARLDAVLSWASPPVPMPDWLTAGLAAPAAFSGGVGFNTAIWQQFCWLCRFVRHWSELDAPERESALSDPWEFRRTVAATPQDSPGIRQSITYLALPGWFEPIVLTRHKKDIVKAFADLIGGARGTSQEDLDRDLRDIRAVLEADSGAHINFYETPYVERWRPADGGARAWLVRPRPMGSDLVREWMSEGFVSLAAMHLAEVEPGASLADVRAAVETGYQHQDYAQRQTLTQEYHSFLSLMKVDDLVATVADDRLFVGVITGEPEYVDQENARLRRAVTWTATGIPRRDVASPIPSLLDQPGTVVDLTAGYAVLASLTSVVIAPDDGDDEAPETSVVADVVPQLPAVSEALAQRLHMDRGQLKEIVDLLQSRQQIVLYGPPGTGKTFLAKELADHLVGDDSSRARLVQFHPSYSYEDFFEGFRPAQTESGQPTFTLQPGPLRDLAGEAGREEGRGEPFVLIIDEMNRANLAKVFGELYFLLEYRNESVRLQYQQADTTSAPFRLPRNVFFIATMNTADRSIAMVDAAIRRRFAFVELHPDEMPVRDVLGRFVAANHREGDRRVELLRALNAAIDDSDRDLRIGPSYLMKPEADTEAGLQRIWRYDLLPLLEEHYYGRLNRKEVHRRFGLASLRAQLDDDESAGGETQALDGAADPAVELEETSGGGAAGSDDAGV